MQLAGRYRLEQRLAGGGMGSVHVGLDERLDRRVAVKLLNPDLAVEADFVERFRREARAAAGLSHPNIAQVYDYGRDGEQHFMVMELVEGTDLAQLLRERGRLPSPEAVDIATQVCAALSAAHAGGIVHRDIKPGNIIVRPNGQVKVTDFGIARAMGQTSLTHTGTVMGTAQYLPPEQARGEPATPGSDLYSLGVVMFQMLTGSVPFTGDSPVAIALQHLHQNVPRPSESTPEVPPALDQVVARATAKDPAERFADAAQMSEALEQDLHAPATLRLPESPSTAALASAPGRRRRILGVGAVLLLVAAVGIGLAVALGSDDTAPPTASRATPSNKPTARTQRPTAPSPRTTKPSGRRSDQPAKRGTERPTGPVVPPGIVGRDGKTVEEVFKARGYDVQHTDVESAAAKDSVVATLPRPGQPLAPGRSLVLVISKGEPPEQDTSYRVPGNVIGADAHDVEERLKAQDIHVTKIPIDSNAAKDTILGTYPAAGAHVQGTELVLLVASGHPPH
jgi:eukaryotic-like serine/threonine-protein kinase